jgi:hypothetical protein
MRLGSVGRTISVFTLLLAAMLTVVAIPLAPAQTSDTPLGQSPPTRVQDTRVQDTRDDGYGKWGLAGLIGLLGLVGLIRRDRTYLTNRAADRPTERVGRP